MKHTHDLMVNAGLYGFLGTGWFVNWFSPQTLQSDILFVGGVFLILLQCAHQVIKIYNEKRRIK